MAAATSPSITALSGGGFETVLVGTDGNLEAGTSSGTVYPAAAVSTGTSPSIA